MEYDDGYDDFGPEPFEDTVLPSFVELMAAGGANSQDPSPEKTTAQASRPSPDMAESLDAYETVRAAVETTPEPYRSQVRRRCDQLLASNSESARRALRLLEIVPWAPPPVRPYDERALVAAFDKALIGAEELKARLIERVRLQDFVRSRTGRDARAKGLLLVGPPGTGKTTISKALAKGLGREHVTVRCHGIADGHTLVGTSEVYTDAGPGAIARAMIGLQHADPVIALEEVGTMAATLNGDPFPSLLQLLDGQDDGWFEDRLMGMLPFGAVSWVLTCNDTSHLPPALIDRVEIFEVAPYTAGQCLRIAREALVPRLLGEHGIERHELTITDAALKVLLEYADGSGVRQLEGALRRILAGSVPDIAAGRRVVVDPTRVRELLADIAPSTLHRHRPGL